MSIIPCPQVSVNQAVDGGLPSPPEISTPKASRISSSKSFARSSKTPILLPPAPATNIPLSMIRNTLASWIAIPAAILVLIPAKAVMISTNVTSTDTAILAIDGEAVAAFTFAHDDAREGVHEMVEKLQQQGITVEILSGDEQASVEAFAERLGINPEICRGNVDPEGKASWVAERAKLSRTLMAGDGFNDSGALAAADIGVAVGSGEQVNLDAADVLIPGEDPRALANLIQLSKRTRRVVNANIAVSVLVTFVLIIIEIEQWCASEI